MFGHRGAVAAQAIEQPVASGLRVGHGLECREGLGGNDEQSLCWIEVAGGFKEVYAIHVRDETECQIALTVVPECLVGHDRTKVGPADPNVDYVAEGFPGMAFPFATADAIGKSGHFVQDIVHVGYHIPAVYDDDGVAWGSQDDVEDSAMFCDVDFLAVEHGVHALAQTRFCGQANEQLQRLVGDAVFGVIKEQTGGVGRESLTTSWVLGEQFAQMDFSELLLVKCQRFPSWAVSERFD